MTNKISKSRRLALTVGLALSSTLIISCGNQSNYAPPPPPFQGGSQILGVWETPPMNNQTNFSGVPGRNSFVLKIETESATLVNRCQFANNGNLTAMAVAPIRIEGEFIHVYPSPSNQQIQGVGVETCASELPAGDYRIGFQNSNQLTVSNTTNAVTMNFVRPSAQLDYLFQTETAPGGNMAPGFQQPRMNGPAGFQPGMGGPGGFQPGMGGPGGFQPGMSGPMGYQGGPGVYPR